MCSLPFQWDKVLTKMFLLFQWDEVLQTMSVGEKAEVTIEPEWAYGRKGAEGYPFVQRNNMKNVFFGARL